MDEKYSFVNILPEYITPYSSAQDAGKISDTYTVFVFSVGIQWVKMTGFSLSSFHNAIELIALSAATMEFSSPVLTFSVSGT